MDKINFSQKKVLVRVDFNVPLNDQFDITDDTRIRAAIPTIRKIIDDGGSAILMSHLGRPKNGPDKKNSLVHIVNHLSDLLKVKVQFADDCIGQSAHTMASSLKPGEVLLLENLRFYKEEEGGDLGFAKKLASLGNYYINDAFGTAHRAHASTAVIAGEFKGACGFGFVMNGELSSIDKVLNSAEKPFCAIMGGSKVSGKILIIKQLMDKIDHLIIGGGMMYTFAKAMGGKIGKSLVEEDKMELVHEIIEMAKQKNVKLHLPVDTVIADNFSNDAATAVAAVGEIPDGWMGMDIGPASAEAFRKVILGAKTILWNGPMGVFEMPSFEMGTKQMALAIAEATRNGSYSLIGGGDSVAAINQYHLADQVSYVSTGGGALLEYIESGSLPGVEAVKNNQ
jgi:phosphoglycerate kinase